MNIFNFKNLMHTWSRFLKEKKRVILFLLCVVAAVYRLLFPEIYCQHDWKKQTTAAVHQWLRALARKRTVCVRIPAATDLSRKKCVRAPLPNTQRYVSVLEFSRTTNKKECPVNWINTPPPPLRWIWNILDKKS